MTFEIGHKISSPGRPKSAKLVTEALNYLMMQPYTGDRIQLPKHPTNAQRIARMLIARTLRGDMEAARETLNRYEGKVAQPLSGDPDGASIITVEQITLKEVARRIGSLLYDAQLDGDKVIDWQNMPMAETPTEEPKPDFADMLS
jgi:hypothetical protein